MKEIVKLGESCEKSVTDHDLSNRNIDQDGKEETYDL